MQITVPLVRKPARIQILSNTQARDVEPLALEDFADDTPISDQPESTQPPTESTPLPDRDPVFTLEQVQQEVQAAYDRGFAEGQEVATAVLQTEINTMTERVRNLGSVIEQLQQQYAQAIASIDRVALDLGVTIARAILGYEADRTVECVVAQARAALAQYHGKDAVRIRLHPQSLEALEKAGNPLAMDTNAQHSITLVADPSVEPGGCILETALGMFDAQLSTQLERARQLVAAQLRDTSLSADEQSTAV
jgi:flagellar biosynthesis/type III secretory pathway protein FliH